MILDTMLNSMENFNFLRGARMEPLFTNKSSWTKQIILEMNRGIASQKWLTIILPICAGLLIILAGILTQVYGICLFGIFFVIFCPIFMMWNLRHAVANQYQQLQQLYHTDVETISSFYEDHFKLHHVQNGADTTINYPQIAKVYETKNLFYLMLATRIVFILEKRGFEGVTADEFGSFIRTHAVGEGQIAFKKKKRKTIFITVAAALVILAVVFISSFFGNTIENMIPKNFSSGNYSIRLTSAFKEYDGEWASSDVTVYYFCDTSEELAVAGSSFDTAAAYIQDKNDSFDIDNNVTAVSDSRAWSTYTENYEGNEILFFDYVIMSNGDFWYTEFYCLAKDAAKYQPLFEKWAKTIKINN
jgi:hypothetical protein